MGFRSDHRRNYLISKSTDKRCRGCKEKIAHEIARITSSVLNFSGLIRGVTWGGGERREELSVRWLVALSSLNLTPANFNCLGFKAYVRAFLIQTLIMARPNVRSILTYCCIQHAVHVWSPWGITQQVAVTFATWARQCCNVLQRLVTLWQHPTTGWPHICSMWAIVMQLAAFKCRKRLATHKQWSPEYDRHEFVTQTFLLDLQKTQCATVLSRSTIKTTI